MFSVIIPVHNKLPHLERSIYSVLNQSFRNFELLLIDDASTDGSSEKLEEFNDPRIRMFKREKPGPGGYAARNLGIENAKYDWICFLDADDEWNLDYLMNIHDVITNNPDVELISTGWMERTVRDSNVNFAEKNQNKVEKNPLEFSIIDYLKNHKKYVCTIVVTAHISLIKKASNFPTDQCRRGGDVDTWIRWIYQSKKCLFIDKILAYYYRDTVNQVTSKPNTFFCAYNSLIKIYELEVNDEKLKQAIRRFINKFLYGMLFRQVESGMPIDYGEIKKMFFNRYSVLRVLKLHLLRLRRII